MEFHHIPVLAAETINGLNIKESGIYVDGTLGGGGHSSLICQKLGDGGRLIAIDQDTNAIQAGSNRLKEFEEKTTFVHSNFNHIKNVLQQLGIAGVDGIMADLGVSSHQLDTGSRGFSYQHDAPLDMRMNQKSQLSAYDVVNTYSEQQLSKIIFDYGEEKWAKRIAKFIVAERENSPIGTTSKLVEVIKKAMPAATRRDGPHPAKRTFQAIRIEVNNELGILEQAIKDFVDVLNPGGRVAIITFHSLEDRIVKQTFQALGTGCICPPEFPICVCNKEPLVKVITRKPISPSEEELERNPRARSAKLRVIEKI